MIIVLIILILLSCNAPEIQAEPSIRKPRDLGVKQSAPAKFRTITSQKKSPVIRNRKGRRKGLTHLSERYTLSTMPYDQLKVAKNKQITNKNFDAAAKYLERLIIISEDVREKAEFIIELADLHFSQQEYDKAKKWYQEFEQLYPGNQLIEQAKKQMILCAKQKILSPDRDQAPTEETLQLAQNYLDNSSFTKFRTDVLTIKKECEATLALADCGVAQSYIKLGNYSSAERRIKGIRSKWVEKVPEISIPLAQLEVDLGIEWKDFKVPEESITLTQAPSIKKSTHKKDMTARF